MSLENSHRSRGPELVTADTIASDTDVLIVGLASGDDGPTLHAVDHVLDTEATRALLDRLAAVGATGKAEESWRVPAPEGLPVRSVLAVGVGASDTVDGDRVRRASGAATRALAGVSSAANTLAAVDVAAAAEGSFLGAYRFTDFRSATSAPKPTETPVSKVTVLVPSVDDATRTALAHARTVADAVALARDLVNTPPSHLYPAEFAERIATAADAAGMAVEVVDEAALAEAGYGGILGVGQGSSRPPRLARLSYTCGHPGARKVALVGKGITFDTGGISIKAASGMEAMTSDMAGAAAVVAAAVAAARLRLDLDVTATIPIAENMPSGTAQRPGDVLTQYGGTTVEVLNTDAEGRLILADAITRACEDEPDYLIDVATLTGAQLVALGPRTFGVMGTDAFSDRVARISRDIGEPGWAMPLPEELRAELTSDIADLANVAGNRNGGMLVAGIFLREFVADGVGWAHLDVAGPAYNRDKPYGHVPKGATGIPVRTLIATLEDLGREQLHA